MKNKIVLIVVTILFLSTIAIAQDKKTIKVDADSVTLQSYNAQKEELIKKIVQLQSDLFELKETREKYYSELSQLNLAISLYEEKLKNKKVNEKEK